MRELVLNDASIAAADQRTAMDWLVDVTNESESLQNNAKLRERRRFKSYDGTRQLFLWHARFSDSGRIHLRFDPSSYEIEIGYIGQHLPLP